MGVAIRPPDEALIRTIHDMQRRLDILERTPSGAGSIGPQFIGEIPRVRLTNSGNQSIATGTGTNILSFDTEDFDNAGMHDPANPTKITIVIPGTYLFEATVVWAAVATGRRKAWIMQNNLSVNYVAVSSVASAGAGDETILSLSGIWRFPGTFRGTSGGSIGGTDCSLNVQQNSGGPVNVLASSGETPPIKTHFSAVWLGPATA